MMIDEIDDFTNDALPISSSNMVFIWSVSSASIVEVHDELNHRDRSMFTFLAPSSLSCYLNMLWWQVILAFIPSP
jgi:hypothetical protein